MATSSILKTVSIRDRKSARALVNALENAKGKKDKNRKRNSKRYRKKRGCDFGDRLLFN